MLQQSVAQLSNHFCEKLVPLGTLKIIPLALDLAIIHNDSHFNILIRRKKCVPPFKIGARVRLFHISLWYYFPELALPKNQSAFLAYLTAPTSLTCANNGRFIIDPIKSI
jgi:hypothetical protein